MAKVKKISLVNYSAEDILRRHWNRSKKARMIDRKKQAKKTFPYSDIYGRNLWYKHPEKYDLIGIDTLNASMERQIPQWDLLEKRKKKRHTSRKHSREEKRKVKYIMQTTGSNYAQARGLLKGRDLSYSTKVRKLEEMIGMAPTKYELYNSRDIKLMEEIFEEQQREFFKKAKF